MDALLTTEQLAEILQIVPATVRRHTIEGVIPSYLIKGARRYKLAEVLEAVRVKPSPMVVPEGYQLVPLIPTPEMLAEITLTDEFSPRAMRARYDALLAAAPQPEGVPC